MELEAVPGVGEQTASALRELEDPEGALEAGDVAALSRAPGISTGRAARIARNAIRARHDDPGGFLQTDRARNIYDELLACLQDRAVTKYGRNRLATLYPSPTRSRVEEVRDLAQRAMDRTPDEAVIGALEDLAPLKSPTGVTIRDRCLATTDAETYQQANTVLPEVPVEIVDDARDLAELARGYPTVIALDEAFAGVDVEGDVRVNPDAIDEPATVAPERVLAFFATNRDSILSAIAVHRESNLEADLDLETLESAVDRVDEDGTPSDDEELQRLTQALDDLDVAVSTAESVANDHLRESIREKDVTVEGADLLSLVEQGAGVDSLLSRELADEFDVAIATAREHLLDALSLTDAEAKYARAIFPENPTFPVNGDDEAVGRLREELKAAKSHRGTALKQELAAELADLEEPTRQLVRDALELDVELAIARFVGTYDCTLPDIEWSGADVGVDIVGGRSPLLSEAVEAIEPVDYRVDGVVLLSGVNSGGKTSTLDLIAAVVVLAHMGLPVPANTARLCSFESLYFHGKTQGTLDAGAFESTVREFADLATGEEGSLVLVDELESITEPGASARIIAGILERLDDNDAVAVFVSHLAAEIRDVADVDVRVDGIEAEGLVDGELVVDRSPRPNHLARSTPELIVEKLADEHDGTFYADLLEKFEE